MKKRQPVEMSEEKKRLLIYLSLLAAAVFFAIQNPAQSWLAIGLGIGLAAAYGPEGVRWLKNRKENEKTIPEQPDQEDDQEKRK
ncbi:hypothetical protein [Caproiciproducens sp.]|uniref:hypothetical protein n=1 Tax=Caproiciproducens sp. TaxID=1954376 RepID=UPI00289D4C3D|nr:hypothetical protein [Caproiciproducens sp.]